MKNRLTKRQAILQFFYANPGVTFPTRAMHDMFGTAFRTRVSEINRERQDIQIVNSTDRSGSFERSSYTARIFA